MSVTRSAGHHVPRSILGRPIAPAAQTWTSEHQPVDHLRVVERKIDRNSAAERQTNKRHAVDGEMLEQSVEIGVGLEGRVSRSRTTEPASIVADDAEVGCKHWELLVPHSTIEIATVEQDDGAPGAEGLVVESSAGDRHKPSIDKIGRAHV